MKYFLVISISLAFFIGCKPKEEEKTIKTTAVKTETAKDKMVIPIIHKKPSALNVKSLDSLKDWKEFNEVKKFLIRFEKISPNEALNNANEVKNLIKELKKNIQLDKFKTDAFNARINVLENEALRLFDMTLIPAITADEVNKQVAKIHQIFGSINAKINSVFLEEHYDNDINLDEIYRLDSMEFNKLEPKKGVNKNTKSKK